MAVGDYFTSIRTSFNERFSNHYRSAWLKWKTTRWYQNLDALMAYREMYETLVNQ